MSDLTLRNVPDDIRRRLEAQAARNHTSPDREALRVLDRVLDRERPIINPLTDALTGRGDVAIEPPTLARLDALHERQRAKGVWLTPDFIDVAIDQGRP